MPPAIFSVGVDLGGTWIRLEAVDAHAHHVKSFRAPAPTLIQLPAFLKKRLRAWKTHPMHLIVASRGIWTGTERARLKRALRPLARTITVMSDVEAAWYAAFKRRSGVVVISGTGSIAYGRDADGCSQRAGGLGPFVGDEGSAFWVGKEWLKQCGVRSAERGGRNAFLKKSNPSSELRTPHSALSSVRRIAALAPGILHKAKNGNRLARHIIREAQNHLADLVISAARPLHFKNALPVSWGGSLLNNPRFRAGFSAALRRKGRRFQFAKPERNPALIIAKLSQRA